MNPNETCNESESDSTSESLDEIIQAHGWTSYGPNETRIVHRSGAFVAPMFLNTGNIGSTPANWHKAMNGLRSLISDANELTEVKSERDNLAEDLAMLRDYAKDGDTASINDYLLLERNSNA